MYKPKKKSNGTILQSKTKTTPDEARTMRDVLSYVPIQFDTNADSKEKKVNIEAIFDKRKKKKLLKNNILSNIINNGLWR